MNARPTVLVAAIFIALLTIANAQSAGIHTGGFAPNVSALPDVNSNTRVFLAMRITEVQNDDIAFPSTGLWIFRPINFLKAERVHTLGASELAINTLPATSIVPLGVHCSASGTYTIAATEINDLQYVTLEDTKTGTFTELSTQPYKFIFAAGENELRFKLHFSALGIIDNQPETANIYSYQKTVFVNLKSQMKANIYIYNLSGQMVASVNSATGSNRINLGDTGIFSVKLISDKTTIFRKVFVQQK